MQQVTDNQVIKLLFAASQIGKPRRIGAFYDSQLGSGNNGKFGYSLCGQRMIKFI